MTSLKRSVLEQFDNAKLRQYLMPRSHYELQAMKSWHWKFCRLEIMSLQQMN